MIIGRSKRNFLVCSDCAYFKPTEIFNDKFPEIKKGECLKHSKKVDNRWETDCEDNTDYFCCEQCSYFEENPYYGTDDDEYDGSKCICSFLDEERNEYDKCCEHFDLIDGDF